MVSVWRDLRDSGVELLLQEHDALLFQYPEGRDDLVRWLLHSWVRCCAALRLTLLPAMRATCATFRALRVCVTLALLRSALCDCLASMRYGCCHMSLPSSAHSLLLPSLVASALQPTHRPKLRRKRIWNVYSCLRLVAARAIARHSVN